MSRYHRFSRMAVALGAVFAFCLSLLYLADSGSGNPSGKNPTTFFLLSQVRQTASPPPANPTNTEDATRYTTTSNHPEAGLFLPNHDGAVPLARPMDEFPLPLEPDAVPQEIEIVEAESAPPRPEGAAPEGRSYREVRALVTAYCPCARCCGRHANGRTSIGTSAWRPGMAADPRAVPYGTLVEVPGYGTYPIDDTGGAMRQSWRRRGVIHIDIRMTYHWQAREWGRQYMTIRIYDPE